MLDCAVSKGPNNGTLLLPQQLRISTADPELYSQEVWSAL
jgi:hypothetical protein